MPRFVAVTGSDEIANEGHGLAHVGSATGRDPNSRKARHREDLHCGQCEVLDVLDVVSSRAKELAKPDTTREVYIVDVGCVTL